MSGGTREVEGTPPRWLSRGSPPSSSAAVAGHSFAHSFIPQPYGPPVPATPQPKGWSFPSGSPEGSASLLTRSAIVVALCCLGGSVELSQHDSAAPLRRARPRRAGWGQSLKPRDLFHRRSGRRKVLCSWSRGREAAQVRWRFRWDQELWPLPPDLLGPGG